MPYGESHMAITSSAKKAIRVSRKKRVFNLRRKSALYDSTKAFTKAVASKDAKAATLLPAAFEAIDKAAKRNVISKNTASRKKARLARMLKAA